MIYAKERAQVICDQLHKLMSVRKKFLTDWRVKEGNFVYPDDADSAEPEWKPFDSRTMHWYGPDRHYWFRTEFAVPQEFNGKPLVVKIRTQIDEPDDGKNPQFLLFVNGSITQGLDMNHREVLLTRQAKSGDIYRLDLQSYTGILHTEFNLIGELVQEDAEIKGLYYDMQVPLWSLNRMDKDSPIRLQIETIVNNTVNLTDLREVYSDAFYNSIKKARAYIGKALYEDMAGFDDMIATCIGHTHIDVAWWWTVAQTREKVARSFATVLKLMDEYPGYKFMSSQPQLYIFLKERYPELYAKIKKRVKEGRWEPEGGMWVEADCNLTSGESLVRQFMYGKRFFMDEFGVDCRELWLPDVFGYSAALPQIMKKCGVDYFMTTKLSWNQFNKIPNDTFLWRGIDGSEVLTHFITAIDVGQKKEKFMTTYNGKLHPDAIMGAYERYQNKEINNDILIAFGYGDGGGGPTREMLETSMRMEKGMKGIPKVRQVFSRQYFDELQDRVRGNPRLETWEGELYFEYHRGTYTSMARNKRSNRKSELMLMDLELLSVIAAGKGIPYPKDKLDSMWKTVLRNQFHDILPGSAIEEVYEVTKAEYGQIRKEGTALIAERLAAFGGKEEAISVFNTLGFTRGALVEIKADSTDSINRANSILVDGKRLPVQRCENSIVTYIPSLPSKGYAGFALSNEKVEEASPFEITNNGITTPYYAIVIDENGLFTSVYDKENGREVLKDGTRGNLFRVYEDKPIYYDNWNIDIYYTEKFWDIDNVTDMRWIEKGPLRATLRVERSYLKSVIRQNIHFYAHSRRIDFETYVDWNEHQQLLKVHFPVEINSDEATFEIQFGNVKRKIHQNTSWEKARFESCAHRWVDLSEGGYGVSILNDCKYGHSIHDGDMALTLIKCGIEPNPNADNEEHWFTYSLYPQTGDWKDAETAHEAAMLNQPALAVRGGTAGKRYSLLSLDKRHVMAETVKRCEDGSGIILRIYEYENQRGIVTASLGSAIESVQECDLLENPISGLPFEDNHFAFFIKPYEIKTFKVVLHDETNL